MLGRVICFSSVQLLSCARLFVTKSRLKRREREERVEAEGRLKSPGFLVHHQLPELAQTHVQQVSDAIQPSYTLSSPSPAFNLSQHQGLFHLDS